MKKIGIIILLIIMIGSFFGYKYYANQKETTASKEKEKTISKELIENVETYQNVPIDKEWVIHFDDEVSQEKLNVEVTDSKDKKMDVDVSLSEEKDSVSIKAPSGGYEKGAYYELFVDPVEYADGEDYPESFQMIFITERETTEQIKVNEELIYIEDTSLLNVDEESSTATLAKTDTLTIQEEDLVVLPIRDGKAIKITSVSEKNDTYEITYTDAQFGEVIESLDIYHTYSFFDDDVQFQPAEGINVELVSKANLDTSLASNQYKTVLAGEHFTVSEGQDGSKKIEVEASDEPLMEFEVSKELLEDQVLSSLSIYITEPEFLLDYKRKWFSIERLNAEVRTDLNILGNLDYDFKFDASNSKKFSDKLSGEIPLGTALYPIGPSGFLLSLDLALSYKIEADGSISGEFIATSNMSSKVSLVKPYKNADYSCAFDIGKDLDVGHTGSANGHFLLTTGMEPQIGVSFLEAIGLGMESYVGPYIEGTAELKNNISGGIDSSANLTVSENGSSSTSGNLSGHLDASNTFCGELAVGVLGNLNVVVDTFKNTPLFEHSTGEKKWEHGRLSTCDQLTDLVVKTKQDLTNLKPGATIPLQIYAEGSNIHTGKSLKEPFKSKEDFEKLQFSISDKDVADIKIRKNKKGVYTAYLVVKENVEKYKTTVTISYTDEANKLEKAFSIGDDQTLSTELQIAIEEPKKKEEPKEENNDQQKAFNNINEAIAVYDRLINSITESFNNAGLKYGETWEDDGDENIISGTWVRGITEDQYRGPFAEELQNYATDNLVYGSLLEIAEQYPFGGGYYPFFPVTSEVGFQFAFRENTNDTATIECKELENDMGYGGKIHVVTMKQTNGKWKIDHFTSEPLDSISDLNLSREDAEEIASSYISSCYTTMRFVEEMTDEVQGKIYTFELVTTLNDGELEIETVAISAKTGENVSTESL